MGWVNTKKRQDLKSKKEELEPVIALPAVRHLIYLINTYDKKMFELEKLSIELNQIDDKIYCAKEYLKLLQAKS